MKAGFIGLGRMGYHMAERLLAAKHQLVVFDTDPAALDRLVQSGATAATDVQTLANEVETILLSLPTPDVVSDVARAISHGKARVVVDLSTTGPETSTHIHASLAKEGISFIDAPVSGGPAGAEAGTLAIMLSGEEQAVQQVQPYLDELGRSFYLGSKPGLGQAMKVINNTLCTVSNVAAFEGLILGTKLGLDSKTMLDVINASSGRSFATEVKIPQCILDRSFPMRFTTELLEKDTRLCIDTAKSNDVPMPVSENALAFLQQGIERGFGKEDYGRLITILEEKTGVVFGHQDKG